ncbi:hypothetical protein BOX15_Mlig020843g1 [Macrostomum lignano]|uniref:Protein kinase domain-containing protein n=1 Tax=Macrostomum lignano TaxID=282301 RepID=A0A267F342_9PLAT|nr:hypothetical protein BOX15_Mlig020843g1 [Macrostomum lignano]
MGNSQAQQLVAMAAKDSHASFNGRETSFRRLRRWASRLSVAAAATKDCQKALKQCRSTPDDTEAQKRIANKWNRESRKRIHRSTLFSKFGASKSKWPVPNVESLFLPDYPVRCCGPQELDGFEVLDVIAAGSFGNVLKVRCDDDKKEYALKVIDKARLVHRCHAMVSQAKEEVSIQSDLSGKSSCFVASLLSHWQTRKRLYLLLEYFPNGELFALWKLHGKFSESLARLYLAELACAIDFLHDSGVVFRDLKLENVVMDSDGHLVLIDFGLSKWLRRGQVTRTMCGTLAYSAPEMLCGRPYNHSVDWWSLGILFYALVTGKFPLHAAPTCRQMRQLVRQHSFEAPASLTWECRYTIERLLQKLPERRIVSLSALARSPFFKGRINFDLVRSRAYEPSSFCTQLDLSCRPSSTEQHQLTRLRRPKFDSEEAITRLIDDESDGEEDGEGEVRDKDDGDTGGDKDCNCCDCCRRDNFEHFEQDDETLVEAFGTKL